MEQGTTTVPNSVVTSPAVSATSVDGVVGTDPPTGTTEGSPSATQAAENNASSSAAAEFQLPGKQLQVLPIGLGVFAGISVIALIVVALVTYERTKYRKVCTSVPFDYDVRHELTSAVYRHSVRENWLNREQQWAMEE
jgi:hypothetical protein